MKKISILYMLLSLLMLSSCAITRTFNVQGKPNSEVCLQTNEKYNVTLDTAGQGKIKWYARTPMPAYFVSNSSSSLTVPAAIDYEIGNNGLGWGVIEIVVGSGLLGASIPTIVFCPIASPLPLSAGLFCCRDGYKRANGWDTQLGVTYLPFHTNDDITFSMEPSRPSGEPKMKRTSEAKQTIGQTKTTSKKTSAKQVSIANDDAFYHTVEQGEKLADIAKNYGVTMAEIIRANKLNSNDLKPGQKLIIPM